VSRDQGGVAATYLWLRAVTRVHHVLPPSRGCNAPDAELVALAVYMHFMCSYGAGRCQFGSLVIQGGSLVAEIRSDGLRIDGPAEKPRLGLHRCMVLEPAGGRIFTSEKLSTVGEWLRLGITTYAKGASASVALG